ncbi:MAG TPA: hypothetical protein CFH84_10640 [Sulfurimonas sp. UBA12504]|nr:MAG: hypothetical protein A2019_05645 [Sulfurimonas sp. GWF2_37_8]DAB29229.1 MAG TPA: hypothetical protein CFH84_10640 [Sulfurimonas sp. UBA12504]
MLLNMQRFKIYCEIAVSRGVVKRAAKVALVVGSALNLINQGESLMLLDFANVNFMKLFLTYIVPYSVTTYTATALKAEFQIGTASSVEADLECTSCKAHIHIHKGQIIPECMVCGIDTHWKLK